jgi:hypothetical protein
VRGREGVPPPSRPRTGHGPHDRKQYLLRVVRRTGPGSATGHGA